MKKMLFLGFLLGLMQACGQDDPGKIKLTLNFDASVTSSIKSSVKQFVFVIGEAGSDKLLLYPSACLSCATNTSPCPVADQCLKSASCGFAATDSTFDPEINFSDVKQGDNMDVISCALDNTATPVSSGQGQVLNKAGASTTITMTSSATTCINNLPPVCL